MLKVIIAQSTNENVILPSSTFLSPITQGVIGAHFMFNSVSRTSISFVLSRPLSMGTESGYGVHILPKGVMWSVNWQH